MSEKLYLYSPKKRQSREILLHAESQIYADDKTAVPEKRLRGFHTNGLIAGNLVSEKLENISEKLNVLLAR
jgi:hypothetical protein